MDITKIRAVLTIICIVVVLVTCALGSMRVYEDHKWTDKSPLSCLHGFSWSRCMLECVYVTMCKSFSHKSEDKKCVLFDETIAEADRHLIANGTGYTWADVSEVPSELLAGDTCASRPCDLYQRCYPVTPYMCVNIDCGEPPMKGELPTDMSVYAGTSLIGSRRHYYCHSSREIELVIYPSEDECLHSAETICMSNFRWTDNYLFCSRRSTVFDCESVRACRRHYMDGEYWIYKKGMFDLPIKVFCYNMTGTPVMYLTLDVDKNFAYHMGAAGGSGMRTTFFDKVRIEYYAIDVYDHTKYKIITDDFTYSVTIGSGLSDTDMAVGSAGGCDTYANTTKAVGTFSIDLTGTTFKLTANNSWTGTAGSVEMTDFLKDDHSITGSCWSSDCADSCLPHGELLIEVDTDHDVPQSSATKPPCP